MANDEDGMGCRGCVGFLYRLRVSRDCIYGLEVMMMMLGGWVDGWMDGLSCVVLHANRRM